MDIIINDMGISVWPIGILTLIVVLVILWSRKRNLSYLFFFSIFWVYVMFGLDKVFFPVEVNGLFVNVMRQVPLMSQVNLIPFYFGQYPPNDAQIIEILSNIILTVPFGFGLNFISQVRARDFIWLSATVGFGLEAVQMVISLALRYPYRVVDINDALLNAAGVLIGCGLFVLFSRIYLIATNRLSIAHKGISEYVYNVAVRSQENS